ncbi:hypothetical protein OIY81_89 [Cryptosporidium canis]|uniref:Uncharacterized protein n=1 Tax=Cryptosporidium canis TaxID=195482 RepID=A0ABQ8PBC0_9CRYT|nr:hypothetical protein OJ252_370 [Cryptosporidium canis]KAJ1615080.1 hypothetical protein OIY81_89 [Cryptosporidium canis]
MQNWEILDDYNPEHENEQTESDDILPVLRGDYDLDTEFINKSINKQLCEIQQLIKGINNEKIDILNAFPSCSLAVIKSLIKGDNIDDENMDIDQMSLSSNEIHSNDSPLLEAHTIIDPQSLTDSPGSMNISDFL